MIRQLGFRLDLVGDLVEGAEILEDDVEIDAKLSVSLYAPRISRAASYARDRTDRAYP